MTRSLTGLAAAALALYLPGVASVATGWTVQPVPLPAHTTHGDLVAVSCASASSCIGVGTATGRSRTVSYLLAEHWTGKTWSVGATPAPAGASVSGLTGVSCVSPSWCMAVGYAYTGPGVAVTVVEHWNGAGWHLQVLPKPGGSTLESVSCSSPENCAAVGSYQRGSNTDTLVERWDGHTWTHQPSPNSADSNVNSLNWVSCTSHTQCVAVGNDDPTPFAESWNGRTWTFQDFQAPAGGLFYRLSSVSCTSATACTAAGSSVTASLAESPLAERWDGSTWTIQDVPLPAGAGNTALYGISCTGAASCTAVGTSAPPRGFPERALAETWNGRRWAIQPTAQPDQKKIMSSVSCVAPRTCTAVGDDATDGTDLNVALPLAEHE